MALRGDDEIDSILAMMGGGDGGDSASNITSYASRSPADRASSASASTAINPSPPKTKNYTSKRDDVKRKDKPKKKKSKNKRSANDTSGVDQASISGNTPSLFADTRLTQNPFNWPCTDDGQRWLHLGCGLAHDCKSYTASSNTDSNINEQLYGFSVCQSCGKSSATHELCLSSPIKDGARSTNDDDVSGRDSVHPYSVQSIAYIIVANRNVRCLIGEYHSSSNTGNLSPPVGSTLSSAELISKRLDVFVGRALAGVRGLLNKVSSARIGQQQKKSSSKSHSRPSDVLSIPTSDVELLRDKSSALIKAAMDYKNAMNSKSINVRDTAVSLIDARLVVMASSDDVYYRCYYAAITSNNATGGAKMMAMIPHPATYFTCPGLTWDSSNIGQRALRFFVDSDDSIIGDTAASLLLDTWGLRSRLSTDNLAGKDDRCSNPLLILWQSRLLETIRHIWTTGYSSVVSRRALLNTTNRKGRLDIKNNNAQEIQLKLNDTTAISDAVSLWRDSVRDYPANYYAYAAPTDEALEAIRSILELSGGGAVEAGAGTGYWAALINRSLGKSKFSVIPYDIAPPSYLSESSAVSNEYHGRIPTFTNVQQANTFEMALSDSERQSMTKTLILCYPPPGSDMGANALSMHLSNGGDTLIHIGEWQGLTGNAAFESLLSKHFICADCNVKYLSMWGSDATYLTIWKRQRDTNDATKHPASYSPAFGYCSSQPCSHLAKRRCRFARCLQYCSIGCFEKHATARRSFLALHMVHVSSDDEDEMKYENDFHFMDLGRIKVVEDDLVEQTKRNRKKRRRR